MIIEAVRNKLVAIERDQSLNTFQSVLKPLREVGIDDFGYFMMSMPDPQFPKLSRLLPRMASDEVQKQWTGAFGEVLLRLTCAFVRSVAYNYAKFVGRPLDGASILDYGCGYGRIARLMFYFSDPSKFVGVDPWDKSIAICRDDGLGNNFLLSSYLPTDLPVGDARFDLSYAFSVFTHLSERATKMSFSVLSKYLQPGGLLVITIRPVEYWQHDAAARNAGVVDRQIALHRERGLSFLPHSRPAVDGDITYGDTSFTTEWLQQNVPELKVLSIDHSLDDPFQCYVFLKKKSL